VDLVDVVDHEDFPRTAARRHGGALVGVLKQFAAVAGADEGHGYLGFIHRDAA
jgi:hypothetical protein